MIAWRSFGSFTFDALRDGQEDTGDKGLAVMGLLEDGDLFSKTGTVEDEN